MPRNARFPGLPENLAGEDRAPAVALTLEDLSTEAAVPEKGPVEHTA